MRVARIAVVLLTLIGIAAALERDRRTEAVLPRAIARGRDIVLRAELVSLDARVAPGQTLASVLRTAAVREQDIVETLKRAASVFDPRKLRAFQRYRIAHGPAGELRRLDYEIDGDKVLRVERPDEDAPIAASIDSIPKVRRLAVVEGRIDRETTSLFAAMEEAGESVELPIALASIFAGEIDFSVDLQPGDRFRVLVDKEYRVDERGRAAAFAGYGPIAAAEFENAGRRLRAVRFSVAGGAADYFDEHGASLRRFFLRSPLKFEPVVTSGFSRNRFHPILREFRPHLGIDYRAPEGAPVVAVADGVVVEAGTSGGAGRMVHLRHANGFESEYLHLSSIAVRAGGHVRQGDLIGRVGATGLATGPHLDYRLKKNGAFINPLTAMRQLPPGEPVPAAELAAFGAGRDQAFSAFAGTGRVASAVTTGNSKP